MIWTIMLMIGPVRVGMDVGGVAVVVDMIAVIVSVRVPVRVGMRVGMGVARFGEALVKHPGPDRNDGEAGNRAKY